MTEYQAMIIERLEKNIAEIANQGILISEAADVQINGHSIRERFNSLRNTAMELMRRLEESLI